MDNEESCCTTFVMTECRLIELKLLGMDRRIRPRDHADVFHILVLVVDYDEISTICFLDSLHPVDMNDTGCHFVLRRSRVDKAELKDF